MLLAWQDSQASLVKVEPQKHRGCLGADPRGPWIPGHTSHKQWGALKPGEVGGPSGLPGPRGGEGSGWRRATRWRRLLHWPQLRHRPASRPRLLGETCRSPPLRQAGAPGAALRVL